MPFKHTLLIATALVSLSACSTRYSDVDDKGQYWQRVAASSGAYLQGPKAQQMLNQDIGRCVVELRELESIGVIRDAIPADRNGRVLDPDQNPSEDEEKMAHWDTPERRGALYAEHSDYHDFDGCMLSKGWERTKYVPYAVAERAEDTYLETQIGYQRNKNAEIKQTTRHKDFQDLNH